MIFDAKYENEITAEILALATPLLNAVGDGFLGQEDTYDICRKYIELDDNEMESRANMLYMFGAKLAHQSNIYDNVMTTLCPYTTIVSQFMTPHSDIKRIMMENQLRGLVGSSFILSEEDEDGIWMVKIYASDPETLVIIKLGL